MNTRRSLGALGLLFLFCLPAAAQGITVESGGRGPAGNERLESPDKRPILRYGGSRSSKAWLEVAGSRVAVDDGLEWQGRRFYITLLFDLVATQVPPKAEGAAGAPADGVLAEKVIWERDIGAFWNQIGIESFESAPGTKVEALALRSTEHPEMVEYVDLGSGKRIGPDPAGAAPGTPIALGGAWKGAEGKFDGAKIELLRTREEWLGARAELFGELASEPPADLGVDFGAFGIVIVYAGKTVNSLGFSAHAFENDSAVVLRLSAHSYQSMGETPDRWPWGVFAVPLRPGKDLVIERNAQNYIGGPALWKERKRFAM
jgi:hypothetical protein